MTDPAPDASFGRPPDGAPGTAPEGADARQTPGSAAPAGARPVPVHPRRVRRGLWGLVETVVIVVVALGLSLLVKTFLVQAFYIPSTSMADTLLVGDRVLVSKLTPSPVALKHGDVVVFKDPGGWLTPTASVDEGPLRNGVRAVLTFVGLLPQDSDEYLIKRVIGLPGDKVVCCDAQGRLQVNGTSINETYIKAGTAVDAASASTAGDTVSSSDRFSITVKTGHLWVMGDNRGDSLDSRFHQEIDGGQVPISNVAGKAFVVVWPLSRFGGVVEPPEVFARVPAASSAG